MFCVCVMCLGLSFFVFARGIAVQDVLFNARFSAFFARFLTMPWLTACRLRTCLPASLADMICLLRVLVLCVCVACRFTFEGDAFCAEVRKPGRLGLRA